MRRLVLKEHSTSGPALRRGWTLNHLTLVQFIALLLPVLASFYARGSVVIPVGGAAIASALVWEAIFAQLRQRSISFHGITTGMIVAIIAPGDADLGHIVLAVSFGAVLAELVFGGRGFGFLNAGVAALAFLLFSFPGIALGGASLPVALAAVPGGLLLLAAGFISWRVIVATLAGFAGISLLINPTVDPVAAATVLSFPVFFLICDPFSAASTNPGRWLYGLLAGGMAALFLSARGMDNGSDALVFAALTSGLFAPLLDEFVLRVLARVREAWRG